MLPWAASTALPQTIDQSLLIRAALRFRNIYLFRQFQQMLNAHFEATDRANKALSLQKIYSAALSCSPNPPYQVLAMVPPNN
jgi:hypothetical protein